MTDDQPSPLTPEELLARWLMDHLVEVNRWMTTGWRDTMFDEGVRLAGQMLDAARAGVREPEEHPDCGDRCACFIRGEAAESDRSNPWA